MRQDRATFLKYQPGVSRETLEKLACYAELLEKWQKRINLVGPKTLDSLWVRHFLDSAQLLERIQQTLPDKPVRQWLDLGSGAGFPGLVIAVLSNETVHLVESDQRKCAFLRQVILETGTQAQIHNTRIEQLTPFAVDIITARALAPLSKLIDYALPFCHSQTEMWFLKGAGVSEELTPVQQSGKVRVDQYPSITHPQGAIIRVRPIAHERSQLAGSDAP